MFKLKTLFFLCTMVMAVAGFASLPAQKTHIISTNTIAFLHPSQAGELEAYARQVMMQQQNKKKEDQVEQANISNGERSHGGPVAWCRKQLFRPFAQAGHPQH
jgi:hypothetical protein